jgi:hypothetical protein
MRNQLFVTAFLAMAFTGAAHAAQPDDAWLAWVGCWRAEGDSSERSICIVPDGDGVRMITLNAGRVESESRIVANGQARTISQEGCTGTETARWSIDRQRVFLNADLNCGNNVTRKVSGVFAVLSPSQWTSVQSIATADNKRLHTVRYVDTQPTSLPEDIAQAFRDNRLARETVRLAAASRLDLADVEEAVKNVEASVVEGWLTTVGQEFDLDAESLIALADAGVPSSVIDVLVAVSNPGRFAVREERASDSDGRRGRSPGRCFDSYWSDPYDPFGYRGGYGYRCGGGFGWGGYYGGGTVIVIDRGNSRSRGKVTKDGYKAPRDAGTAGSTSSTSKASAPKSSGDSDSSSSGSSGSGGRKAKPRDN